ncbi:MAG: GGDEF domain-containing protein [Gammaproteobacteria bacterium]
MIEQRSAPGLPNLLKKLGAMTAIRDTYMVEQSLLRTLGPLLAVPEASFYRFDENRNVIRALYHSRKVLQHDQAKRIVENVEEIISDKEIPELVQGIFESVRLLRKAYSRKVGDDYMVCYPIYGNNELIGFFLFQRDREVTATEDAIIHGVLEVFTNYIDLLDTSQRDQLTGLHNRYSLELNLNRLWNLMSNQPQHLTGHNVKQVIVTDHYWVAVIDIDHFKKINDRFGHTIGDEVLIMVTRLLQASFRQSDLLYRHGGEEFVAIISAGTLEAAEHIFERVRLKIEQFLFPQVEHVTVSGGFSCADPCVLPQEVINRADSALYAAKSAGRNRIFHYDTLVADGIIKPVESGSIDLF